MMANEENYSWLSRDTSRYTRVETQFEVGIGGFEHVD